MVDTVRDIILVLAGIMVLIVLNRANTQKKRVPTRVWPFLLVGFVLLIFGRSLEMTADDALMVPPLTKVILQEVVGFCLGFLALSAGLIRWLPELTGPSRTTRTHVVKSGRSLHPAMPGATGGAVGATRAPADAAPLPEDEPTARDMLDSILKSSLNGVMVLRAIRDDATELEDFEVRLMNEAAQQILGRSARSMFGQRLLRSFPCIAAENLLGHAQSVIETGLPFRNERCFNHDRNRRWYEFVAVKTRDGLVVTFADVSAQKQAEEQLRHAAHHDNLTGLPNRALFTERLGQAFNRSRRFKDFEFAMLFLDFDGFKAVNDTLGHEAGDQLLIGISERLRSNLRVLDTSTRVGEEEQMPARLGGDEFVVLLENVGETADAVAVAERLLHELSKPHEIDGQDVVSTASIGIVTSKLGYEDADAIIRDADTAMYHAKMAGKARYVVFDEQMHEEASSRSSLERDLRQSVDTLDFDLAFAPVVALDSGSLSGFEASIAWDHPTGGQLTASEFFDLADEVGVTATIGRWMLENACARLRAWRDRSDDHKDLTLEIRLTPTQVRHGDLIPTIENALATSGLPASALRLGITPDQHAADVCGRLRDMGLQVALRDFGGGQASLNCIRRLPVDVLRIDESLARGMKSRRESAAIMNAIVELAHNLDMQVVATGVEDDEHVALLQALGCDHGQGAAFGGAIDAAACADLLDRERPFGKAA